MAEQLDLFLSGDDDAIREECLNLFLAGEGRKAWGLYSASRGFAILRRNRLIIANWHCERCKTAGPLQMHHLTYERRFFEEIEDVRMVCRQCHEYLTGLDMPDADAA